MSDGSAVGRGRPIGTSTVTVSARSVMVLAEHAREPRGLVAADPGLLERLARAAGIARDWWDVDGRRTVVTDDTRRALLAAMRLPATTMGEARDTLRLLDQEGGRRPLPWALVARGHEPLSLPLAIEPGTGRRSVWLTIEREDRETQRTRLDAEDGELADRIGADGLPARVWRVDLRRSHPAVPCLA